MIQPRISRIDDNIAELRSEIFGQQRRLDEMPQHAVIAGFEEQISVSCKAYDAMLEDVNERETSADTLETQAQNLIMIAKEKQKAATTIRVETKNVRKGPLKIQQTQILALKSELARVQKELNHQSHGSKRRIRIAYKKLDRLEARRRRIVIDAGLDPEVVPEDEGGLVTPTTENHSSL
jgi:DNA repair exonuclease SbcCD ATPase subunit